MNRNFSLLFLFALLTFFIVVPSVVSIVNADSTDCRIIYGGGEVCMTPTPGPILKNVTPTNSQPTPTPRPTNAPTTKGGLKVFPPTQTKTTPKTGPEALSLISLIPTAGLGFWLRRKK